MNRRQQRVLAAIFARPTRGTVAWSDFLALMRALGADCEEAEGSRVRFMLHGEPVALHRPHPGRELRKYQVDQMRGYLDRKGIRP
jgi:hypothetical protein